MKNPHAKLNVYDLMTQLQRLFPVKQYPMILDGVTLTTDQESQVRSDVFELKKTLYHHADLTISDEEIEIHERDIQYQTYKMKLDLYFEEENRKKEEMKKEAIAEALRPWGYDELSNVAFQEANILVQKMGKTEFVMDSEAHRIWHLLCLYFTGNAAFNNVKCDLQTEKGDTRYYNLRNPIILMGPVGTGKSTILRAFKRNKRQCFRFITANDISEKASMKEVGIPSLAKYSKPAKANAGDETTFYQNYFGWMIDDIGTETPTINNMGTKVNCIEKILLAYHNYLSEENPFGLHFTTNLSMNEIQEIYGEKVRDRLKETHNILYYKGDSRR